MFNGESLNILEQSPKQNPEQDRWLRWMHGPESECSAWRPPEEGAESSFVTLGIYVVLALLRALSRAAPPSTPEPVPWKYKNLRCGNEKRRIWEVGGATSGSRTSGITCFLPAQALFKDIPVAVAQAALPSSRFSRSTQAESRYVRAQEPGEGRPGSPAQGETHTCCDRRGRRAKRLSRGLR